MSELIFTEAVFFNILNRAKKKVVINLVINARRLLDIIGSEIQIACHVTYIYTSNNSTLIDPNVK